MRINKIHLENYRGAKKLEVNFHDKLTVLVGKNGAGKSSVLDAGKIMLSWFVARLRSESGRGLPIDVNGIKNGESQAEIRVECGFSDSSPNIEWNIVKTRPGRSMIKRSEFSAISEKAKALQLKLTEHPETTVFPLIAFYPVDRAVLDIPLRIRGKHKFEKIEAYDSALLGSANFRLFFEWFRNREDLENETKVAENDLSKTDTQLTAVRESIEKFMPGFARLSVKRSPLRMVVSKLEEQLLVNQLSTGEKCLLAMVGDLARRLAIANPSSTKPLESEGIIFIDELDLHLHPDWQRTVTKNLTSVFPNCQFIVSTHSPQILGEVQPESIRVLKNVTGGIEIETPGVSIGLDSAEILDSIMDAPLRNKETTDSLQRIFGLIDKDDYTNAASEIDALKAKIRGSIPEIVRAETMISLLQP